MSAAFADTFFYLALLRIDDPAHTKALANAALKQPIVTSEFVLLELGNACARATDHADFLALVEGMRASRRVLIVPLDSHLLNRGLALEAGYEMVAAQRTASSGNSLPGDLFQFPGRHRAGGIGDGRLRTVGAEMNRPRTKKGIMTTKLDLYKLHKAEYVAPTKPVLVRTKPARYLAIAGQGAPGGPRFTACVAALYGAAFTIKMRRKFAGKEDYVVCKLEGQWFFENQPFATPKDEWKWRLLIRTPDFIGPRDLETAASLLLKKGKSKEISEVTLETMDEGSCVQMLHLGPYEKENASIALMRSFAEANGLKPSGPHHEIYLSDPRRVPPEKLKTILRQPALKQDS